MWDFSDDWLYQLFECIHCSTSIGLVVGDLMSLVMLRVLVVQDMSISEL